MITDTTVVMNKTAINAVPPRPHMLVVATLPCGIIDDDTLFNKYEYVAGWLTTQEYEYTEHCSAFILTFTDEASVDSVKASKAITKTTIRGEDCILFEKQL